MSEPAEGIDKAKREHGLNVLVSWELKERLKGLAKRYDRPTTDIIRAVLKVGIPLFEGLSEAEETIVKEYVQLFRRLRNVKSLKGI